MQSNSLDLLKMLEPAVRPTGVGASGAVARGKLPIERRSFDELLNQAQPAAEVAGEPVAVEPARSDPLAALAGLGSIESASLRGLIAGRRGSA